MCFTVARRCISLSKDTEPRNNIIAYQNNMFDNELKRQKEAVGRIEKIVVKYNGVPESVTLSMNKEISTPYHCAKRMVNMNDFYSSHLVFSH